MGLLPPFRLLTSISEGNFIKNHSPASYCTYSITKTELQIIVTDFARSDRVYIVISSMENHPTLDKN